MNTILLKVGERLQGARKIAGLTQAQVEAVLGINKAQLSYYETGKREISITLLEKLATLYGFSLEHFLNNKAQAEPEFQIAFRAEELSIEDIKVINWAKNFLSNLCEMKGLNR